MLYTTSRSYCYWVIAAVAVLGGGPRSHGPGPRSFHAQKGPRPPPLPPMHLSECPKVFGKMSQSCPRCPQNGFNSIKIKKIPTHIFKSSLQDMSQSYSRWPPKWPELDQNLKIFSSTPPPPPPPPPPQTPSCYKMNLVGSLSERRWALPIR